VPAVFGLVQSNKGIHRRPLEVSAPWTALFAPGTRHSHTAFWGRIVPRVPAHAEPVFLSLVLALLALCLPKSAWGGPGNRKTSSADEPKGRLAVSIVVIVASDFVKRRNSPT
jgi:uncharacterized membrane protein YdfJ with MMPL/SSD domain